MFGLFQSPRAKLKKQAEQSFATYLPALRGMNPEEIAFVLDQAVQIKNATTLYGSKELEMLLFHDPIMVSEDYAFDTLFTWLAYMKEQSGSADGLSKVASLSVWWLSVASIHIAELRVHGKELWAELVRAYPYTQIFDPTIDYVIGLEPASR